MNRYSIIAYKVGQMSMPAPLHLHILTHPRSAEANDLADALMRRFVEPPASGGLRIPVFFAPDHGDGLPPAWDTDEGICLDAARHTILIVLGDARMVRTIPSGTGDAWIAFVREALVRTPLNAGPHHTLPVALDPEGFQLAGRHHILPALLETGIPYPDAAEWRLAALSFHIAARAIQLLTEGRVSAVAPDRMKAPVQIFFSHAKADLAVDRQDPVRQTRDFMQRQELPVDQWYDAKDIAPGQEFEDAIRAGIRDCSIMLAFHTDQYGSRPWCRREVLEAKEYGAHILVVDALESGESRSFPYAGNVPIIRWQFRDPQIDARRVIDRAVLEALRFKHNRATLEALAEPGERVLAAPPEAVTLVYAENQHQVLLYPDPPLGREELELLQRLRPGLDAVTPLTKTARWRRPEWINTLAVSISESDDTRRYGLSTQHFDTLTDEIHLYLLLAGLKIAYGGALKADFSKGSNFTLRLFELVRAYSGLAAGVGAQPLTGVILNIAPWPLYLDYGEDEWRLFSHKTADYDQAPRPDLPWSDDELFPPDGAQRKLPSDTPERRYAWARGLTTMRKRIGEKSQARLVLGGKLRGFAGLVPGVVEEVWLSLISQSPVFVAGGFGGAARAIADRLRGSTRPEFEAKWSRENVPDYEASRAFYFHSDVEFTSLEQMGQDIGERGALGLEAALNNGLDESENRELLLCTNPQRIAHLVLTGLARL